MAPPDAASLGSLLLKSHPAARITAAQPLVVTATQPASTAAPTTAAAAVGDRGVALSGRATSSSLVQAVAGTRLAFRQQLAGAAVGPASQADLDDVSEEIASQVVDEVALELEQLCGFDFIASFIVSRLIPPTPKPQSAHITMIPVRSANQFLVVCSQLFFPS